MYLGICHPCPQFATCSANDFVCEDDKFRIDEEDAKLCVNCMESAVCDGSSEFVCENGSFRFEYAC